MIPLDNGTLLIFFAFFVGILAGSFMKDIVIKEEITWNFIRVGEKENEKSIQE